MPTEFVLKLIVTRIIVSVRNEPEASRSSLLSMPNTMMFTRFSIKLKSESDSSAASDMGVGVGSGVMAGVGAAVAAASGVCSGAGAGIAGPGAAVGVLSNNAAGELIRK